MNVVNSMTNWNQEERNTYIRKFIEPYYYLIPDSYYIEIEVVIKNVLRNNIHQKANIYTHTIIDKYFNTNTIEGSNDDYSKFYKNMNFCLVPLYIEPNKKSSERLLVVYKKLIKTIWSSITLLKQNIRKFSDQEIYSDDDDIKDYDKTMELYHSSEIIKKNKINNAIEIRSRKKFILTEIDIDNFYLAFDLFLLCFQTAGIITKTKQGYHLYYRYCDKLKKLF